MKPRKHRVPPIYRKPPSVPATPERLREWAQPDPLGRMLAEWTGALHELLTREGVPVEATVPFAEWEARLGRGSIDARIVEGGQVWYREADASPLALEAIDALAAIEAIRRKSGDYRVLAAVDFGQALERLRATAAFAAALDSYRRSHRQAVTDDQIRAAVVAHRTRAEAAAALGITTRRLQDHCKRLRLPAKRNRKPTISDTR